MSRTTTKTADVWVRLDAATKAAVELAAAHDGIPVSTWIRNQIVTGLYLEGVAAAPQTIYQGIRHALKRELDGLVEVRTALDGLIAALPDLIALAASVQESDAIREAAIEALEAALGEAFAIDGGVDASWRCDLL
ncbi:hypothetical protein [Sulfobacillus harzensis]|uniref:Uncharacterized protein n=1 Tax=Sulfobacillus harzensis TaxID=2729629 RepID=A0A7Y0L7U6_9FIRM|nr:hypothetical protein [Sulfobacillus harzensis]NMP24356.1 hypothetical protein [Sulfobacillus harzensis]